MLNRFDTSRASLPSLAKAVLVASLVAAVGTTVTPALAQTDGASSTVRVSGNPARDNLTKLQRSVTTELNETRLEDAIKFIADTTGAEFDTVWKADRGEGLDRETPLTMSIKNMPAAVMLEKILAKALGEDSGDEGVWQVNDLGQIQLGTKKQFTKAAFRRVEIYDIEDLIIRVPLFTEAPTLDLSQAMQSRKGGGGSNPFQTQGAGQRETPEQRETRRKERAEELIGIITAYAEKSSWLDGGGDLERPKYYMGRIIVDAPDYVHRAVVGYRWWPQSRSVGPSGGRRYVMLNGTYEDSSLQRLKPFPVPAIVANGQIFGGGPPLP